MLEHGVDVNAASSKTTRTESTVVAAINHVDNEQTALKRTRFIVERAGATIRGSGGLRYAAKRGYLSVVEYLFSKAQDIEDAVPSDNLEASKSALTEAARQGHVEVIEFLLEHGADVSFRTEGAQREVPHGAALELAELGGHVEAAGIICDWTKKTEKPL